MQHLLVTLVVVLVISALYKVAANQGNSTTGPACLVAYGRTFHYMVYFFWFCVIGFLVFGFIEGPNSQGELVAGIFGMLAFSALVLVLHLEFLRVRIEYDADAIRSTSPWRSPRQIPWADISDVQFSQSLQWYLVRTKNNGSLRCHIYLSGLRQFLSELENRGYNLPEVHPLKQVLR